MDTIIHQMADALRAMVNTSRGGKEANEEANLAAIRKAIVILQIIDTATLPSDGHSEGRWRIGDFAGVSGDEISIKSVADESTVCATWMLGEDFDATISGSVQELPRAYANARRIVACVNACIGIPTAALESQSTTPAN